MRLLPRILLALALAATSPAFAWSPLGSPARPIITLQLNPDHPEILYARVYLSEGPEEDYLWRSEDGGASWRNIQSGLEKPVSALAIDPSNPRVIWVWTADSQLWRSGDAGETWAHRYTQTGFHQPQVFQLLVDPDHPETIYRVDYEGTGSGTGVSVSRDGGLTFSAGGDFVPHFSGLDSIYPRRGHGELVSFDERGLEVSVDAGQTWTLRGTIRDGFTGGRIAPSSPDVFYGLTFETSRCLARSDDAGAHWTALAYPPRVPVAHSRCYDVTIDPKDARHVWVAIEVAEIGGFRYLIAESHDGGATWSRPLPVPTTGVLAAGGDLLYTDGVRGAGLFVSRDGGHTWTAIDRGILAGDLRYGFVAQRPPGNRTGRRLLSINTPAGSSPAGLYRSDGGIDWIQAPLLYPTQVAGAGGSNAVAIDQNGLQRSQNGGASWQRLTSTPLPYDLLSDVTQPRYLGLQTFVPDDAYGRTPLWASDDGGATWRRASRGLPVTCSHIASVDVCPSFSGYTVDPFNPSRRWLFVIDAYPGQPRVFLSESSGASWELEAVLPTPLLALAADPRVKDRLLAGTYAGLLVSEDAGRSWHPLGDLPDGAVVRQFARDERTGTWYASTLAHGIYRSLDGGAHWTLLAGAPDHDAPTIAVDPRGPGALLAAFRGQGIWRWTP